MLSNSPILRSLLVLKQNSVQKSFSKIQPGEVSKHTSIRNRLQVDFVQKQLEFNLGINNYRYNLDNPTFMPISYKYPMIVILVPLVLFYPFSFQRNHIKPFIFSRTQWSNRLVIMIRFQLEVLVHKSDNFIIQSIANCGGSNRSPPYQVQYQIPTEPTHNGSFVLCFCMIYNLQIK